MARKKHWRDFLDSDWLRACDLQGREVTVTIEKVEGGSVTGVGGKRSKKPVLHFVGKEKPFAFGATIGKTIEAMYGSDPDEWTGKRITLYETTTQAAGGETVACIRVRPRIPAGAPAKPDAPAREPGADDGVVP